MAEAKEAGAQRRTRQGRMPTASPRLTLHVTPDEYILLHVTFLWEVHVSPARARKGLRTPVAQRVQKHRKALRAAGLRPIQIWVPDVRSKRFAAQAHRQSLAVANSSYEKDDQGFVDSISARNAT
jgi:hypothetical protein